MFEHTTQIRVRYGETDQMGTFYNSRASDWFEIGRTELLRALGLSCAAIEERGVFLPLTEAHVEFLGRARYDDLLEITAGVVLSGRARPRFEVSIAHAPAGSAVARGYTIRAITGTAGRPVRPPQWLAELIGPAGSNEPWNQKANF
jgi:acyl-CoA thioester hydrolase